MNGTQPPRIPTAPAKKSGLPIWAIVLIVLGIAGVVGIALIGMLAAIAIPNFVKARTTAQMNACINNLRQIDGAKHAWALEQKKNAGDAVTAADISPFLPPSGLTCPGGGTYQINPVGEDPTCSRPGHVLPK
jgi:hypothetical protein